ncbi:brassinosteroid-responsive RING protein 1-like [Typha angustifolia]|uniref:brassinosteroid-responsive RING protein 1-like n=1 Tax=Typha angustifolia TaxID=59011 RepID=UPI003C2C936A
MGFPLVYSDLLLPKFLLQLVLLVGSLRRFLSRAFHAVGLGDLLDPDDHPWLNPSPNTPTQSAHNLPRRFLPASSLVIDEVLPVMRYEELLLADEGAIHPGDGCAVCLSDFERSEEVRRLSNCRHVFHRGCLDRWIGHEQRTCPLCRALLVPEEAADALGGERIWASAGIPDSYDFDFDSFSMPSPTLFLPHQLLPGGQ